MSIRWLEGFETWGNLNDLRTVWIDHFYGKYSPAYCEDYTPKLVEGYKGIGLAYYNGDFLYNFFSIALEQRQIWTVGFAYKVPALAYVNGESVVTFKDGDSSQLELKVFLDAGPGSRIALYTGNTYREDLGFYPPDEWIYIEVQCTVDNTNGSYECKVDGITVCSDTNVDTSYSGNPYATMFKFGSSDGSYDDIYILDDATGLDDFLGPIKVKRALPTSDSSVQWFRSAGVDNYANVDEVPSSLTDYNYSKITNQLDLFDFEDSVDDILGVQLNVDAKLSEPGGMSLILVCDSNAVQQTDEFPVGDSSDVIVYTLVIDTDPDTSALWTKTGFNSATWGVKVK